MKKAFTLIELIFVILILGILSAVAITKLAATRDDAEVVKAAANLATAINDLNVYYTANGSFSKNFKDMTSAVASLGEGHGMLKIKGDKDCVKIQAINADDKSDTSDSALNKALASKIMLDFNTAGKDDATCIMLAKMPALRNICGSGDDEIISECEIIVSGYNVTW